MTYESGNSDRGKFKSLLWDAGLISHNCPVRRKPKWWVKSPTLLREEIPNYRDSLNHGTTARGNKSQGAGNHTDGGNNMPKDSARLEARGSGHSGIMRKAAPRQLDYESDSDNKLVILFISHLPILSQPLYSRAAAVVGGLRSDARPRSPEAQRILEDRTYPEFITTTGQAHSFIELEMNPPTKHPQFDLFRGAVEGLRSKTGISRSHPQNTEGLFKPASVPLHSPFQRSMGNTISTLQTSLLFGALSMLPGNTFPYIALCLASASLGAYAVQHYTPSQRLLRLEDAITTTDEILGGAKLDCARDHMTLIERGGLLLEAKLSASEIQTKILEARDKTWEEYFQAIKEIMEEISKCAKDVTAIHTSTLLTIEAERQRQLSAGIQESHEIFTAVVRSPTRHAQLPSRRSALSATNLSSMRLTKILVFLLAIRIVIRVFSAVHELLKV
ncbi:hypothetical protein B0H17DRAFT_1175754 [Mycena rosella]|uniref:Uncharacterized protein n=1 Tax=Mycena rosella TaxID=1033263 RepID=A0AAD7M6Z2_MYCRO|nr:hypothetical protein B0H17DRAFT_1175754 [Mycena rosella]